MWQPTAMIAAAGSAGLLAAVLAYLAAVEPTNRVWRLWSASFAMDAARTMALAGDPAHGTFADIAAEMLSVGHVGLLTIGILLWAGTVGPLRLIVAGTAAAALWAGACTLAGLGEAAIHLPIDLYFAAVLGLAAWALWVQAAPGERLVRRATAVVASAWLVQELASATIGWHEQADALGFVFAHGYGDALALLMIVAALRRRHAEALAAIEEARRTKAEADHANLRLLDFARTSSDWFWEQDAELRFTYLSHSVFQHSALTPEDHVGKTRRETGPLGVSDEAWAEHDATLARREPFKDFRFYRQAPDGSRRCLSISGVPVFDEDGRFTGYRGAGRDLTALIAAEQHIDTINSRLLQAVEARSEGLAFWDPEDRLVMCNRAYRDQSGNARSALVAGVHFADYLRASVAAGEIPAAIGREDDWIRERLELRRNLPYSIEIFRGQRWLLIREQRTPDGGALITVTDITELKRREDALVSAVTEAQMANRSKMAFLATMSHELRTPLNAIIGFAEIIQSGQISSDAAVHAEYAGYIHESGTHLLSVINDLLDVSRIEAGRLTLDEKPFALSSLLEECDRMVRQRAQAEGLRLVVAAVDPGLAIRGDRRALKQVMLNLLSNAIKFTGNGGSVTLTADRDAAGGLRMTVSDTGVGVPEDRVTHLFEPFQQLDNVHARRHHGTGLGLYISKSLVEAHGGSIRFESKVGQGSSVIVTLSPDRLVESDSLGRRRAAV